MIHQYAQKMHRWLESTPDKKLLAITHDRKCCDAMGAVMGFAHYAKQFGKDVTCVLARPRSQPMSERLYAELVASKGLFVLGEELEERGELEKKVAQHTAIFALDTSSTQNSTYLPIILAGARLQIFCIDHHETGFEDISHYPHSDIIRVEDAQSTSGLLVSLLHEQDCFPDDQETLIALYMGVYQDTLMVPPKHYSSFTTEAFTLLEERLHLKSKSYIDDLMSTVYPLQWQLTANKIITNAAKKKCLIVGLGVIDNPGIVAYVADNLLAHGVSTAIVLGLNEERIGKKMYRDLVASGRSNDQFASLLPTIFGTIFYITADGRLVSKGGGKMTGDLASCAASVPLSPRVDAQQQWLQEVKKIKQELLGCHLSEEWTIFDYGKTSL